MVKLLKKPSQRRGAVLIWFAFVIFTFFAIAALVIDVGIVVLAKRQISGAVEAAAVTNARVEIDSPKAKQVFETHFTSHVSAFDSGNLPSPEPDYILGAGANVAFTNDGVAVGSGVTADQGFSSVGMWRTTGADLNFRPNGTVQLLRGKRNCSITTGQPSSC